MDTPIWSAALANWIIKTHFFQTQLIYFIKSKHIKIVSMNWNASNLSL